LDEKTKGPTRVFRERRPGNKWIVRIEGLHLDPQSLKDLTRRLKKSLGTGGKVEKGVIQIQGDRRDDVIRHLTKEGIAAKPAGG
jgi:translation initiation factor 1